MPSNNDEKIDVIAILDSIDAFTLVAYLTTRDDVKAIQRKTDTRKVIEATLKELDQKIATEIADTETICGDGGVITFDADKEKFPAIITGMLVNGVRLDEAQGPTFTSMAARVTEYLEAVTPEPEGNDDTIEGGEE